MLNIPMPDFRYPSATEWPSLYHKNPFLSSLRNPEDLFHDLDEDDATFILEEIDHRIESLLSQEPACPEALEAVAHVIDVASLVAVVLDGSESGRTLESSLAKRRCVFLCSLCGFLMAEGRGSMSGLLLLVLDQPSKPFPFSPAEGGR
jgi:hypothetical protein